MLRYLRCLLLEKIPAARPFDFPQGELGSALPIRVICEGMKFVQEAVLKNSEGSGCRKDGKRVTISAVGMLKPAGAYGRCSWIAIWSDSPYLRMSTGAKHLHGDRPAYLSACKRLTRFRPPAQPKK